MSFASGANNLYTIKFCSNATVPVSSNFEVILMFTRQFANNPWVNDENLSYIKISLLQLARP